MTVKIESNGGEKRLVLANIEPLRKVAVAQVEGIRIRLRSATGEALDRVRSTLDGLKGAPSEVQGYIEIVAPLDERNEGRWKLPGRFGVDAKVRQAIKANPVVEEIVEVV